jgi:hypothetical protein
MLGFAVGQAAILLLAWAITAVNRRQNTAQYPDFASPKVNTAPIKLPVWESNPIMGILLWQKLDFSVK